MRIKRNVAIAAAAVTALAAAGGGAYAATQGSSTSPQSARQAFLSDVAKRLGVPESKLTAALKAAFIDQLNAAVKAGKLTQAQATAIAKRVQQGQLPPLGPGARLGAGRGGLGGLVGPPGRAGLGAPVGGPGGTLAAAASYLGLTRPQLRTQLESGKTLAQIAKSRGKSTSGLQQAMEAALKSRLDKAVKSGRITSAQEQQILKTLSTELANQINGKAPALGHLGFNHRGFGAPGPWNAPGGPNPPNAPNPPSGP